MKSWILLFGLLLLGGCMMSKNYVAMSKVCGDKGDSMLFNEDWFTQCDFKMERGECYSDSKIIDDTSMLLVDGKAIPYSQIEPLLVNYSNLCDNIKAIVG